MKKFLFVCGNYHPMPYANGICVLRLQEALKAKGIDSDVVCSSEETGKKMSDFGNIYFAKKPIIKNKILRRIVRFCIWPIVDLRIVDSYKNAIKTAIGENDYLCVIGVLRPIEGTIACASCGEFLIYECDSISNNGDNLYGIKRLLKHRVLLIERYLYNKAGHIFHLDCHRNYYSSKNKYKRYSNKSSYVDIPHFYSPENAAQMGSVSSHDGINITYLGSLSPKRNPPDYSINLLKEVEKLIPISCSFYSRGCEESLNNAQQYNSGVFHSMGYVPQEALVNVKNLTDCFLSIGFNYTGTVTSIPSKIFEYMSTGKPIIHVSGGNNDTAIPYLQKYGNALIVDPKESMNENAALVEKFLKEYADKRIELEDLRKRFPMNTPEYTINLLLDYIEKRRT